MDEEARQRQLRDILANIGREICRPIDSLRGGIVRLLDDPDRPLTDVEQAHARTMLAICDELGLMTRDCLDHTAPADDGAQSGPAVP